MFCEVCARCESRRRASLRIAARSAVVVLASRCDLCNNYHLQFGRSISEQRYLQCGSQQQLMNEIAI